MVLSRRKSAEAGRNLALDGVRGIAVLLVMAHHFFSFQPLNTAGRFLYGLTRSGWIGVDLFFVLSGFLITGILYDAKTSKNYFPNFYARRALRVFPLYYLYLAAYVVFVIQFKLVRFDPTRIAGAAREMPWLWLYASNILVAIRGNYITASLNHFWSLAVEEHFYLLWPALVFFLDRKKAMTACSLAVVISFALRFWIISRWGATYAVHVLTPCRLDGFAVGGFMALALRAPRPSAVLLQILRAGSFASCLFLVAMGMERGSLIAGDRWLQTVGYPLIAIAFGGLILSSIQSKADSAWGRVIQSRTLRFFGKYSYGLYVWHFPVQIALERVWPTQRLTERFGSQILGVGAHVSAALFVSVTVAFLSWNWFEIHFIRLKARFEAREKRHSSLQAKAA